MTKIKLTFRVIVAVACIFGLTNCTTAVVAGAGAAAGTGAAVGTDTRGSSTVISDQTLEHKVNNALDAQVPQGSYTVASYDSEVLLAGQVPNQKVKAKALLAATNTEGVKKVFDYLTIESNENASSISSDAYITTMAKSKLIAESNVRANNIKVVTSNGVVYLLGKNSGKKKAIQNAIKKIKVMDGVNSVVNLIK